MRKKILNGQKHFCLLLNRCLLIQIHILFLAYFPQLNKWAKYSVYPVQSVFSGSSPNVFCSIVKETDFMQIFIWKSRNNEWSQPTFNPLEWNEWIAFLITSQVPFLISAHIDAQQIRQIHTDFCWSCSLVFKIFLPTLFLICDLWSHRSIFLLNVMKQSNII